MDRIAKKTARDRAGAPHLQAGDAYRIESGLDLLFPPGNSATKVPVRWKQFLITWSAIFPLVLGVPLALLPLLRGLGLPESRYLHTFLVTGCVVALMVYVIMPRYTRLVRGWLYR